MVNYVLASGYRALLLFGVICIIAAIAIAVYNSREEQGPFWFIYMMPIVFAVLGGAVLFFGVRMMNRDLAREQERTWLQSNGKTIELDRYHVYLSRYSDNGSWVVYGTWKNPADGVEYEFESRLYDDPTPAKSSEKIKWLIDPNDPKRNCYKSNGKDQIPIKKRAPKTSPP